MDTAAYVFAMIAFVLCLSLQAQMLDARRQISQLLEREGKHLELTNDIAELMRRTTDVYKSTAD